MMTLEQYLEAISAGEVLIGQGGRSREGLVDGVRALTFDDPIADLTAEAFSREVFTPETSWESAQGVLRTALKARASEGINGEGAVGLVCGIRESLDATGASWRVRVLRFGRSLNGWLWTPESGAELVKHLTDAPVGFYGYQNGVAAHAQEEAVMAASGPLIRNIIGDLQRPSVEGDGVYADLHVHEDAGWLRTKLLGLQKRGVLDKVIGLSVDTLAGYVPVQLQEGAAKAIKTIRKLISVDIVSAPSADGRFLRATAGPLLITDHAEREEDMKLSELLAIVKEHRPALLEGKDVEKITEDEAKVLVREALKPLAAAPKAEEPKPDQKPEWAVKLERDLAVRESAARVTEALTASTLPEPAKAKLRKSWEGRIVEAEEISSSIKAEAEMLAKISESGDIKGFGAGKAEIIVESRDKIQADLDKLFGVTPDTFKRAMESAPFLHAGTAARVTESRGPSYEAEKYVKGEGFRGLRHFYETVTGDREVSGRIDARRVTESQFSADWTNILANTLYRRMLMTYALPMYNERSIAMYGSAVDFRNKEVTILDYFPDIATVDPEAADYAEIATLSDAKVTYAVIQKGNLLTISRKTIINDDLRVVNQLVDRMGRSFRRTLARFVWAFWTGNSTYDVDSVAWFNAAHGNTGSTALTADATGAAEVIAKWVQLAEMTEQGSGEKLGMPERGSLWLDIPQALFGIANLLNQTQLFSTTVVNQAYGLFGPNNERINVNPLFTDATDWGLHVAPGSGGRESIQIDFLNGREEPEFFLADQPTVGQAFVADKIQYKGRLEFGGDIMDYRGATKNVVAG